MKKEISNEEDLDLIRDAELKAQTGIEQSRISEILHYKIAKFTIDELLIWLHVLSEHSPKVREHLLFLEEAMNVPMMSVKETKELTRTIRKISTTADSRMYL